MARKKPLKNDLSYPYSLIAEFASMNTAEKMYEYFSGQQVTFPKRFITSEATNSGIMADYGSGEKIPSLVRKYHLCESTIRRIINEEKRKKSREQLEE